MTPRLQQAHQVFLPGEPTREESRRASRQRRGRGWFLDRILHYGNTLRWCNIFEGGRHAWCLRDKEFCLSQQSNSKMTKPRSFEVPNLAKFPTDRRKGEKRPAM